MSINKRKFPSASSSSLPSDSDFPASKRIKLTNHSHAQRERNFLLHITESGVIKSTDFIDFATVVPESITACHAPDELKTKGERKRWREEMRGRAVRVQSKGFVGRAGRRDGQVVDVKRAASTRLVQPAVKEWHGAGEYRPVWRKARDGVDSVAAKPSDAVAHTASDRNPALHLTRSGAQGETAPCVKRAKPSEASVPSSSAEQRRVSPLRRTMPIYKAPGLKRFDDLPLPRKAPPGLDDSDESIESDSDSSEDDKDIAVKPPVRGSYSESFAERIFTAQDVLDTPNGVEGSEETHKSAKSSSEMPDLHSNNRIGTADLDQKDGNSKVHMHIDASAIISKEPDLSKRARRRARLSQERHEANLVRAQVVLTSKNNKPSDARIQLLPRSSTQPKTAVTSHVPSSLLSKASTGTDQEANTLAARPATVMTKTTFAEAEAGGNRSGSGPSSGRTATLTEVSSNRRRTRQELFDTGEELEDVYEAIEDVTEELLGESLLSMDQCKLPHSRHPACEVDLDSLVTVDHSARKVSTSQDAIVMMMHDDGSSFDDWALEDADVGAVMYEQAEAGGTVVEQISGDVAVESAKPSNSLASSDLTEMSRTPSPPNVDQKTESPSSAENAIASGTRNPVSTVSRGSPKVAVPLRLKMTGMFSKHFSPAKKPRSRKSDDPKDQTPAKSYVKTAPADLDSPLTALQAALDRIVFPSNGDADRADGKTITDPVIGPATDGSTTPGINKSGAKQKKKAPKRTSKKADDAIDATNADGNQTNPMPCQQDDVQTPARQTRSAVKTAGSKRRSTGRISEHFITDRVDLYNTTAGGGRLPAGTSRAPVPSINAAMFGLIQEKIWREPFWLIIAVTFLNKTAGRSAVPIFWKLKEKYPTSEALAEADQADLLEMVRHLGLQNQRSKRLIQIAKAWTAEPPVAGKRYRTLNYPSRGDGKASGTSKVVEEDAEDCAGLLEIGNIPGCGQYAYDSWRIFCRDALRNVADDYNGTNSKIEGSVPEWQRVLPDDKELRACLRWMWLREGWIWDPLTGDKRRATEEEMEKAVKGEMEIDDPQERKFAAQAAGVKVNASKAKRGGTDRSLDETPVQTRRRPSTSDVRAGPAVLEQGSQHKVNDEKVVKEERECDGATQEDHLPAVVTRRTSSSTAKNETRPKTPSNEPRRRKRSKKSNSTTAKEETRQRRSNRLRAAMAKT